MAANLPPGMKDTYGLCCLKRCLESHKDNKIGHLCARVDVRAFQASNSKFAVQWKPGGNATFHRHCWDVLCQSTKDVFFPKRIQLSDKERSMVLEARKTAEFHDSQIDVVNEAKRIAEILKTSPYAIAFTGAGISTAAGIGDFRGISGKWTEQEKKKNYGQQAVQKSQRSFSIEELRPTYTHEALVKLLEMGVLKYLISQNTDGLHRLSGVPPNKISELHGNSFTEKCETCPARYDLTFACRRSTGDFPRVSCPRCRICHRTGRKCSQPGCDSYLMNTIINFGDYLEPQIIGRAEEEASQAYCVLALGSTLRVTPASTLVTMGPQPHRLVICNRQKTPYDDECEETGQDGTKLGSRVYGDCDRLMRLVMANILSEQDLQDWEGQREQRLIEYGLKRTRVH